MKFAVGLPKLNDAFVKALIENREHIYEVYFSWADFPNGRSLQTLDTDLTPWEMLDRQRNALSSLAEADIPLNILFNANCYGKDSQSRAFFVKVGETVDYVKNNYGLSSVTTTSPLIAKFIKANFEDLSVRASVNMEIGTAEGMKYVADYFDSYYVKRELNRDIGAIKRLKEWSDANGKKLFLLANSGCLNFCSAHNFHDNLVAHEAQIAAMDNAYTFHGICHEFLKREENYTALIDNTNFIRPEDIAKYEGLAEAVKLATRTNPRPETVLKSYISGKYSGDILRLLEPSHNIYPYVIENGEPLRLRRINTDINFLEDSNAIK